MRKTAAYIFILWISAMFLATCRDGNIKETEKPQEVDTMEILVSQVEKCSRIYTAEYKVHKIVTHGDELRMKAKLMNQDINVPLPVGQRKIAIPIDATIKAYVDLGTFSRKNINRLGDRIEIVLPDPRVELTASRISHSEIKKQVALLRRNFSGAEMESYEKQGREAIINDIPNMGIIEMSRQSASKILVPLFAGMGFKEENITITFRKDFTAKEIRQLIDPTTTIEGR